jgi:hypothetical protein
MRIAEYGLSVCAPTIVIPSEVEESRGVTFKVSQRDPSTDARDDEFKGLPTKSLETKPVSYK